MDSFSILFFLNCFFRTLVFTEYRPSGQKIQNQETFLFLIKSFCFFLKSTHLETQSLEDSLKRALHLHLHNHKLENRC